MSGIRGSGSTDFSSELESVFIEDKQKAVATDADIGTVAVELVPNLSTSYTGITGTQVVGKLNDKVLFQKCLALSMFALVIGLLCFPKQRAKFGDGVLRGLCRKGFYCLGPKFFSKSMPYFSPASKTTSSYKAALALVARSSSRKRASSA